MRDLGECLFQHGRELEEAQCVTGRCGVEDYGFVGEGFDLFQDFGEGHCFVDSGDLGGGGACQFLFLIVVGR